MLRFSLKPLLMQPIKEPRSLTLVEGPNGHSLSNRVTVELMFPCPKPSVTLLNMPIAKESFLSSQQEMTVPIQIKPPTCPLASFLKDQNLIPLPSEPLIKMVIDPYGGLLVQIMEKH